MDIAQIIQWYQAGEMAKVQAGCHQLLSQPHEQRAILCYLLGLSLMQSGGEREAGQWLQEAALLQPTHAEFQCDWGNWLELQGRLTEAEGCYRQAISLDLSSPDPRWFLGRVLAKSGKTQPALVTLTELVERHPNHAGGHLWLAKIFFESGRPLEASVHVGIYNQLSPQQPLALDSAPLDSLFLQIQEARACAKQRHKVTGEKIHCGFDGVQLCFAFGQKEEGDPPSLIAIPPNGVDQFFYQTPLRLPSRIIFDATDPQQCQRARQLATMIHTVQQHRQEIGIRHITAFQQRPLLAKGPLRILLPSSRADLDSRFFAEGMAHAFQSLGCEVRTLFEDLTRERYDTLNWLDLFQEYHPHVVFSISQHLNYWFHPQTVNVIWWQDPVGQLCRGERFAWRPRDINFSFSRELDDYLRKAGAPEDGLLRQGFCADEFIFKPATPPLTRENKVVFVGSSYVNKGILAETIHTSAGQKVYHTLLERMEAGQPFPRSLAGQLAAESGLSEHAVFWYYLHYVIRDQCVRWLCQASDLLPVEVYGGGKWAEDPLVAPFYKGYLPRGEAVAHLYQQAKFTLVSHPFDLHSERLMEVAACGSIPIVYDCRPWSEPPHWDDHCLWFRTAQELRNCLQTTQWPDPTPIAQHANYQTFARRVLQEVAKREFWPLQEMGITLA